MFCTSQKEFLKAEWEAQPSALWQHLPVSILGICTVSIFEIMLETFLFDNAYSWGWIRGS